LRINTKGRCSRAAQADFFLDGCDGVNANSRVKPLLCFQQSQGLCDDKRTRFVVKTSRRNSISKQLLKLVLVSNYVA
jgi:hypothetical protein